MYVVEHYNIKLYIYSNNNKMVIIKVVENIVVETFEIVQPG